MFGHLCWCLIPKESGDASCGRCGGIVYEGGLVVQEGTWRLALAIAEVAMGQRAAGAAHTVKGAALDDLPSHSAIR